MSIELFNRKKVIALWVLFIICGVLLLLGIRALINKPKEKAVANPNVVVDSRVLGNEEKNDPIAQAAKELENRNVFFAGINDATIDRETVIELENPEANDDILISYQVINNDTGEELFKTDYVPAGEHIDWKASDNLEPGSYELCFRQNPVWQASNGEYLPLTSADNVVQITMVQ